MTGAFERLLFSLNRAPANLDSWNLWYDLGLGINGKLSTHDSGHEISKIENVQISNVRKCPIPKKVA